ncbi:MAG TPA: NAD(P)/FAD-dependent oxidoreductase [Desulfomicrobiaceae bacterium]|nr:NAD(P)/FAD-dependent oxidoreductase [Desulfomicrobiaceae bacterium]
MHTSDIIVIGGGPAGLLAAGTAAELGARVLLLEKKDRTGRKLAITGHGRGNLSNTASRKDFPAAFGQNGRFLNQAFSRFFTPDLLDLLDSLGLPTKVEDRGRIIPVCENASRVAEVLAEWACSKGVQIRTSCAVRGLEVDNNRIMGVRDHKDRLIPARAVILACGGASYPATGSTGDGYSLARDIGHTVIPPLPGLVPLNTAGPTAQAMQGVTMDDAGIMLRVDGKKRGEARGGLLFTHFGVSGPAILKLSREAVPALAANQECTLEIDFVPGRERSDMDRSLQKALDKSGKQKLGNLLQQFLQPKCVAACLEQTGIDGNKPGHQISGAERKKILFWTKELPLKLTGHRSMQEAMVTLGGISLKEVVPKTLQSRIVRGVFLAGEVLDVDGETGGFNLQAAFSTGVLAGTAAGHMIGKPQSQEKLP